MHYRYREKQDHVIPSGLLLPSRGLPWPPLALIHPPWPLLALIHSKLLIAPAQLATGGGLQEDRLRGGRGGRFAPLPSRYPQTKSENFEKSKEKN